MPQTDQRADVGATSSTPAASTASTTSSGTAVTQPAGNAAAVEDAGLATGATAADDAVLDDIVGGMLELLPLGAALPCAWSVRTLPQVRAWLSGVDMGAVTQDAPDFVMTLLDKVFPDGSSLSTGLKAKATAEMIVGAESSYTLARAGSTLSYTVRGVVEAGGELSAGGEMKGISGTPLAEAVAELGATGSTGIEATWEFPVGESALPASLYRCAIDLNDLDLDALCRDVGAAVDALLTTARPAALSLTGSGKAFAEAGTDFSPAAQASGVGTDLVGVEMSAEAEAGTTVGYDSDGAYIEVSASGSGEVKGWAGLSNLLDSVGCHLGDLAGKVGMGFRVRAQGSKEAIQAALDSGFADTSGFSFQVGITKTWGGATTEEVATVDSISGVASYFAAAAAQAEDPASVFDTWESCPADPSGAAEIPDVGLERSMTIELGDAPAADKLLPGWAERAAAVLPDHGVLTGVTARSLEGRVRVGSEAVKALMGDPSFSIAPTEEAVIALERILLDGAVATASTGGLATTPWAGRDLSRVADLVHFDALELVAEVTFEAGVEAEATEGTKVELEGTASMSMSRRMEVTGQTQAELAAKLV